MGKVRSIWFVMVAGVSKNSPVIVSNKPEQGIPRAWDVFGWVQKLLPGTDQYENAMKK